MGSKISVKSHIPNAITSANLLMGCISISLSFHDHMLAASVLIFVAGVLDFLDGMAARLLKAYSEIGKMLDSLADVVSFGVAPSIILFNMLKGSIHTSFLTLDLQEYTWMAEAIPYLAFLVAIFSAMRLAKFNIDTRQTDSFIGIPTPANAFLIASLPFILNRSDLMFNILHNVYFLIALTIVLSALLVSEIPMISLKFKSISFRDNKSRYILLFLSLLLILVLQMLAIPAIFLLYILISLVDKPQQLSK